MLQVRIERTPRKKYPAIREHTDKDNKSLIVLNSKGKRKKANNHLIRIAVNDIAVVCIYYADQYFINIYKILEIDTDQGFMYVDKINDYEDWSELVEAVEEAKKLATREV